MKLRIRDNSIRFRLTRAEVDVLRNVGLIEATLNFPGGDKVHYAVKSLQDCVSPAASFANNTIGLHLPKTIVERWADSDQVSIAASESLEDGSVLTLLLEKDFACLAPRDGEDETDMFPHPREGQDTC